jgi:hypothetical protein
MLMEQREVIEAFVSYLRDHGYPSLEVERWPDEENRTSPDIDAIAGPLAIEHTSIDTLPKQRRDAHWFMRVAGELEQELQTKPSFRLNVTLAYDAIPKGQDWDAIRASLRTWIANDTPALSDGRHILENLPGIPFRVDVVKSSNRRPGVYFSRREPKDDTLHERIRESFERKAVKLSKYHADGKATILLIENDDIALMNEWKLLEAIRTAYPKCPPDGVEQVWYADSSIPSEIQFQNLTRELW